jgi:hypothetical protein
VNFTRSCEAMLQASRETVTRLRRVTTAIQLQIDASHRLIADSASILASLSVDHRDESTARADQADAAVPTVCLVPLQTRL